MIQKLAAETGVIGLAAFAAVVISFARLMLLARKKFPDGPDRHALLFLTLAAAGAVAYQLFNTNYWTGKMWLPIGLAVAASFALRDKGGKADRAREPV